MFPTSVFYLELPESLSGERSVVRMNNAAVRFAMQDALEEHHKRRYPKHFQVEARSRYAHVRRKPSWVEKKKRRFGSEARADIVASGMTKREMLSHKRITVSGAAGKGQVRGTLRTRFPFPASYEKSTNRVTLKQMAKEITTITRDETNDMAARFKQQHAEHQQAALKRSPRIRKRLGK